MRENKNRYSEYTLSKIKDFILKNVDKIELNGGDMHLYIPKKENLKILRENQSIISYVLNDTLNFKKVRDHIINKNFIKQVQIRRVPCGECDAIIFKLNLRIIIPSGSVSIYYPYSNDYYNELIQLEKELYK